MVILVFVAVVVVAFLFAQWSTAAQADYLKVRAAKLGDAGPLYSAGLYERYARSPLLWFREMLGLWRGQLRVLTLPQSDPAVEAARLRFDRRQRIAVAVYAAGVLVILVSAAVAR